MKCPKCNYTSFDYLTECKKCGQLLDEVKKRLNLQLSKPILTIEETVEQETENVEEISGIDEKKTNFFADQEASLAEMEEQQEEELITINSMMEKEGLGSMESLQSEDIASVETNAMEFGDTQGEESLEIISDFNPSDEQLEGLQFQEDTATGEDMPELDMEISGDANDSSDNYDHEKIIELSEEDQVFDLELELDLDDTKTTNS